MITTSKKKTAARLTNHIRLMIYSYIDTKTCLTHLIRLGKKEKERMMDSYFIREGREHTFTASKEKSHIRKAPYWSINEFDNPFCHSISIFDKNAHLLINLVDKIRLDFSTLYNPKSVNNNDSCGT